MKNKIFNTQAIRRWDQFTMEKEKISSLQLMERAGKELTRKIFTLSRGESKKALILVGPGNNGGDGLVIGRKLIQAGWKVDFYLPLGLNKMSKDSKENWVLVKEFNPTFHTNTFSLPNPQETILVDCLFGTGMTRSIEGDLSKVVLTLNQHHFHKVISVDLPSGMFTDSASILSNETIVRASHTLTIGQLKLCMLLPENQNYIGEVKCVDIGLHASFDSPSPYFLSSGAELTSKNKTFTHKGDFGHLAVIAGSDSSLGAGLLSAKAAFKAGCGLVTGFFPTEFSTEAYSFLPEMMLGKMDGHAIDPKVLNRCNSIAIGPGLGTNKNAQKLVFETLQYAQDHDLSIVIDADALNILSKNTSDLQSLLPKKAVLTPHPGELKRLCGNWKNDFERLEIALNFAAKHQVYLVIKGKYSTICCPDSNAYFNNSGNSQLSTAGSGDVLTGIIGSLLAQGVSPKNAAIKGVYVHGLCSDIYDDNHDRKSMSSQDVISLIPHSLKINSI